MKINKIWYKYLYEDVRVSKINPKTHFLQYGKSENRIGSKQDFTFNLSTLETAIYFFYVIYLVFKNSKVAFISTLFKLIVVKYECSRFKNYSLNLIIVLPWFKGGTYEAFNCYRKKIYFDKDFLVFTGIKDSNSNDESPMFMSLNIKGKKIKNNIIYFPSQFINNYSKRSNIDLHFNHCLGIEFLLNNLNSSKHINIIYFLHDYYLFSSYPHIYDEKNSLNLDFESTLEKFPNKKIPLQELINKVHLFVSPSLSMTNSLQGHLPSEKLITLYHPEESNLENYPVKEITEKQKYLVAVIGNLGNYKGLKQVKDLIHYCRLYNVPFQIIHLGSPKITNVDNYYQNLMNLDRSEITDLINRSNFDFCWLPFQCNESYSFTISDVLLTGLPLITTNIPIVYERTMNRERTIIIKSTSTTIETLESFQELIVKKSKSNSEMHTLKNYFFDLKKVSNLRLRDRHDYGLLFTSK